jgi:predicted nucleic acid-binding protein
MTTTTLVDSNVILDVVTDDQEWGDWSASMLARAAHEGRIVINPLIYAEVSVRYARIEDLDEALPPAYFTREPLPWAAAFLAAKAFLKYRRRGGSRPAPLPDFYIGAHAALAGYTLLTRDPRRYRTCYPSLRIVQP